MGKFVVKDSFYNKAKKEGFRARSAYKLKEIQDKYHLIRKGDRVLDLGCSPGSFLQVLSDLVGEKGSVLGIDILPTPKLQQTNVTAVQMDIRHLDFSKPPFGPSSNDFDVVTCDIAPNLSGIRDVDNARIEELSETVLKIVREALKQNGAFILKSFFVETLKTTMQDLRRLFGNVTLYKPAASRSVSSEVYLICTTKKQGTERKEHSAG